MLDIKYLKEKKISVLLSHLDFRVNLLLKTNLGMLTNMDAMVTATYSTKVTDCRGSEGCCKIPYLPKLMYLPVVAKK